VSPETRDFWVTVHGERAADFERVFGTTTVAVRSPAQSLARLPGLEEPQAIFELDLEWVAEIGRREQLVRFLAGRFDYPASEVERDLDRVGMPVLARDCYVVVHHPQRWF
jgi:hypothetical protein